MTVPAEHDSGAALEEVLVWGLGSGRRVRALLRDGKRVEVLAIDVDPARRDVAEATVRACPRLSEAERDGRLRVLVAPAEQLAARFSMLADERPNAGSMHVDLAALSCVPAAAQDLARMIERLWTERADLERFAPRLQANLRENLDAIAGAPSLDGWHDVARGRPGFVLAAGPSARAALPWLRHARTLGPLIAVDTCLPLCREARLPIDCLVSVDPHASSRVHLSSGTEGVGTLAFQPYCAPAVVSAFERRVIALPAGDRLCDRAGQELGLPSLPVAGTVLLFALQIAALMGCDPIVVVGADFAHVGGLSHAEGTATARALAPTGIEVPDWRGNAIPSSSSLRRFKGDVEQHIAGAAPRHWAVDGGGAAIAGTRAVTPRAIERWIMRTANRVEPFTLRAPAAVDELQLARSMRSWRRLFAEFDVG